MYTVCFVLPAHLHVNSHGLQKFRALLLFTLFWVWYSCMLLKCPAELAQMNLYNYLPC